MADRTCSASCHEEREGNLRDWSTEIQPGHGFWTRRLRRPISGAASAKAWLSHVATGRVSLKHKVAGYMKRIEHGS